jgi:hypothetical protein
MGTAPIPGTNGTWLDLRTMRRLPLNDDDDGWSLSLNDISPEENESSTCSQRLMLATLMLVVRFEVARRCDCLRESPWRLVRGVLIGNRELFWPQGIKPKPGTYMLEASDMLGDVALTWFWDEAATTGVERDELFKKEPKIILDIGHRDHNVHASFSLYPSRSTVRCTYYSVLGVIEYLLTVLV